MQFIQMLILSEETTVSEDNVLYDDATELKYDDDTNVIYVE